MFFQSPGAYGIVAGELYPDGNTESGVTEVILSLSLEEHLEKSLNSLDWHSNGSKEDQNSDRNRNMEDSPLGFI